MTPRWLAWCVGSAAAVASLGLGCNAILGYDAATLEATPSTPADAGQEAGPVTGCAAYCAAIQSACTGSNLEYLNAQVCNDMCPVFDPGVPGDTTQNSLACRIAHLPMAQQNPAVGCPQAGPTGAGACGPTPCTPFCSLDVHLCQSQTAPPYPDEVTCDTACAAFAYDAGAGDLAESAGNTLNCRIYHLESAYDTTDNTSSAANTHCPHTAVTSATCH